MVRKFLLALALIILGYASPAFAAPCLYAGNFTQPTDVSACVLVAPTFKTDGTTNSPVDPAVTPPSQSGLTEVNPTTVTTNRINAFNATGATFSGGVISDATHLTFTSLTSGAIKIGDMLYGPAVGQTNGSVRPTITSGSGTTWVISGGSGYVGQTVLGTTNPNFCLVNNPPSSYGPWSCNQAKFRTVIDSNHILFDDPVRNFSAPGASHCHEFFGNKHTNGNSRYADLRNNNSSDSAGADVNGTGYWFPCPIIKAANTGFGDGHDYVVHSEYHVVYYVMSPSSGQVAAHLFPGQRYVSGANMDDPEQTWLLKYIYAANQASTNHNRYSLTDTNGHFNTQASFHCLGASPPVADYLNNNTDNGNNPAGDPFAGTCNGANVTASVDNGTPGVAGNTLHVTSVASGTLTVGETLWSVANSPTITAQTGGTTGGVGTYTISGSAVSVTSQQMVIANDFYIGVNASACWDGTNLWSPGGYYHLIPEIWDSQISGWICPSNYYIVPQLEMEFHFTQLGWNDYWRWRFASDDSMKTKWDSLPLCLTDYSNAPCATSTSPHTVLNGQSFHFDWMMGWDKTTFFTMQEQCIGVGHNTPHECDSSQFDSSHYLVGGNVGEIGPNGTVQVLTGIGRYPDNVASNMFVISSSQHGPMTMPTNTH